MVAPTPGVDTDPNPAPDFDPRAVIDIGDDSLDMMGEIDVADPELMTVKP